MLNEETNEENVDRLGKIGRMVEYCIDILLHVCQKEVTMAMDSVCKMLINPARAVGSSTYKEMTYYFCAFSCKEKFDRNPEKYAAK